MNDFQDWLMTLPKQTLTDELKIEILSKVDGMIKEELGKLNVGVVYNMILNYFDIVE